MTLDDLKPEEKEELSRSPAELDQICRRTFSRDWIILSFLLLIPLVYLILYFPGYYEKSMGMAILLVIWVSVELFVLIFMGASSTLYRLEDAPVEQFGLHPKADFTEVLKEVSEDLGGTEQPRVYISVDKNANAFAINSMFFNFFPMQNAVYLNTYLFNALPICQIKSILAHELAHFHRYLSPIARNYWISIFGMMALPLLCINLFGIAYKNPVIVIAFVPSFWFILFSKLATRRNKSLEYACDSVAAETVGALPIINALLAIHDRAEAIELVEIRLLELMEQNPKLAADKVVQDLMARVPEHPVTLSQMRRLLEEPIGESFSTILQNPSKTASLRSNLKKNRTLRKALKVIRWSDFDVIRPDRQLDQEELHTYVLELIKRPDTVTNRSVSQHPEKLVSALHPACRKRIIYLYWHYLHPDSLSKRITS